MAISKKVEELTALLKPVVEGCNFMLWGVEFLQQGKHSVLRVYIDTEREAGVSVDDCSTVSHQLSGVLDVEDPIAGVYTLEVSSPGWDRLLFTADQYPRFMGEQVSMRLTAPLQGRRRLKGKMLRCDESSVVVLVDEQEFTVPFVSIDKANIEPTF